MSVSYSEISSSEEISKNGKWLEWFLKVWGEEVHGLSICVSWLRGGLWIGGLSLLMEGLWPWLSQASSYHCGFLSGGNRLLTLGSHLRTVASPALGLPFTRKKKRFVLIVAPSLEGTGRTIPFCEVIQINILVKTKLRAFHVPGIDLIKWLNNLEALPVRSQHSNISVIKCNCYDHVSLCRLMYRENLVAWSQLKGLPQELSIPDFCSLSRDSGIQMLQNSKYY